MHLGKVFAETETIKNLYEMDSSDPNTRIYTHAVPTNR